MKRPVATELAWAMEAQVSPDWTVYGVPVQNAVADAEVSVAVTVLVAAVGAGVE